MTWFPGSISVIIFHSNWIKISFTVSRNLHYCWSNCYKFQHIHNSTTVMKDAKFCTDRFCCRLESRINFPCNLHCVVSHYWNGTKYCSPEIRSLKPEVNTFSISEVSPFVMKVSVIISIFDMVHCSQAAVLPVNYDYDIWFFWLFWKKTWKKKAWNSPQEVWFLQYMNFERIFWVFHEKMVLLWGLWSLGAYFFIVPK